ncbi:hypothetical protein [Streptomyces sp. NPDC091371]|uniref:hypothetical protein n=1 Tax=Streptomyces sp. NPDC091371 TaxID=3155303 RepID=UPI0034184337
MNRDRGDQELRDFYELLMRRADLDGPDQAALLEAWNAEQQRKHERLQRADDWKRQRFETVMGFFALLALLGATVWLAQNGQEWIAVVLAVLSLVVVGKFLGRPVTASEANLVGSAVTGAFRGLRQNLTGAAPQPAPSVGSPPTTPPVL